MKWIGTWLPYAAALAAALLAAEVALQRESTAVPGEKAAQARGESWDNRTPIEAWRDERRRDPRAAVNIAPWLTTKIDATGTVYPTLISSTGPFLPLGGQADRRTVYCNETGKYVIYDSDERGFRNPKGLWAAPVDVVIVGDSYGNGACVDDLHHHTTLVRAAFPKTLNLSGSGNGALSMLAYMREYGPYLKPRYVVWLFNEGNDIDNLQQEQQSPLMRSYMTDPGFSQNLMARQDEIDAAFQTFAEQALAQFEARPVAQTPGLWAIGLDTLKLRHVRRALKLPRFRSAPPAASEPPPPPKPEPAGWDPKVYADFSRILAQVNTEVRRNGGTLVFAYLPAWMRGRSSQSVTAQLADIESHIRDAVREQGISYLDISAALLAETDPDHLVWFPGSHFNHRGYEVIGRAMTAHLKALP